MKFSSTLKFLARGLLCICALVVLLFFIFPLPGKPTVLMYHFIGSKLDTQSSANFVTEATFEKQMAFLRKLGYRIITLNEFHDWIDCKRRGRFREILITFDDGNQSVYDKAWPILKKYQIPSVQFLITENLKNSGYGSMSIQDAKRMAADPLVQIGSHTQTHAYLTQISDEKLHTELEGSRQELQSIFHTPITSLAYPYGDLDERVVQAAIDTGYHSAFTTSPKKLKSLQKSNHALLRVKISEGSANLIVFWVKLSGIYETFKHWRHKNKTR